MEKLQISPNKRYLTTESGKPFFYLGDTAWLIFRCCSREDADLLLQDRANKGFTVIQTIALTRNNPPNVYGHVPLHDNDPLKPVEEYWQHVDWIVQRTNELGMYVGVAPAFGETWFYDNPLLTPENAREYGLWLGKRYRDAGIIWLIGGDKEIHTERHTLTNRALAEGLKEGCEGNHLCTFHPRGGGQSSSMFVNSEHWLDFHMQQTGHSREQENWRLYLNDWRSIPHRPFVDGEPPYEGHPNNFMDGEEGWLDQIDLRRNLYWAICGGATGFTYGCHTIWQFWQPRNAPDDAASAAGNESHALPGTIEIEEGPWGSWKESLSYPGSEQMQYGKRLALSRIHLDRKELPDRKRFIVSARGSGSYFGMGTYTIRGSMGVDGSWAMLYVPDGRKVTVNLEHMSACRVKVTYYNPRTGSSVDGGEMQGKQERTLMPPFDPYGRDWVILLDDPEKAHPAP